MSCKARYAVIKYIQGDVVGVYDSTGAIVADSAAIAGAAAYGGSIAVPAMGVSLGRQSIFALIEMVL